MKVLVTGATGFVGSNLTKKLVESGYEVKVLVRDKSNTSYLESLGVEVIRGDILDVAVVEEAVKECQHVYHLAAQMLQGGISKKIYYTANVKGTKNVAHAAIKANVKRFVHASSAGVYGIITHPPVDENTTPNPSSAYRESKFLAEQTVLSYHQKEGLPLVIARLPGVIGPGSLTWLGLVRAISKKNFRIIGTGENYDHLGYISDVVDGLYLCAKTQGIEGESYNIAADEAIKVRDLVDIIAKELGIGNSISSLPVAPYRAFNFVAEKVYKYSGLELPGVHRYPLFLANKILNISKAQKQLGYSPKVGNEEAIQKMVRWYQESRYIQC
jgi:nucleoside-diphosphate-sugar epimerase